MTGTTRVKQSCGNRACCRPDHLQASDPQLDDPAARADETRRRRRKMIEGNGHLERRGKDSWRMVVFRGVDRATGQRRYSRRSFRGTTAEAQVAMAKFIVELPEEALELDTRNLTFGELVDLWYDHVVPDLGPRRGRPTATNSATGRRRELRSFPVGGRQARLGINLEGEREAVGRAVPSRSIGWASFAHSSPVWMLQPRSKPMDWAGCRGWGGLSLTAGLPFRRIA